MKGEGLRYEEMLGLQVTAGGLALQVPLPGDIPALTATAAGRIHDPGYMPFSVPWTEGPPNERVEALRRWLTHSLETSSADKWNLIFGVRSAGEWIGSTNLFADRFAETKAVSTGSWLLARAQGRGYGKLMRAAILELAFGTLGADRAVSEAFEDNRPSRGVNESLGYRIVGERWVARRGEPAKMLEYRLESSDWTYPSDLPMAVIAESWIQRMAKASRADEVAIRPPGTVHGDA